MYRRFTDRILGGVCGGLGRVTPFSAWVWRVGFILLALLTGGAGVLVYLALWWLLPQDSLVETRGGASVGGLFGILVTILLIGGYLGRETLATLSTTGHDVYWPFALTLLALIFFGKQLFARRTRRNLPWGFVVLAVALAWLLGELGVLPTGIYDLLWRSWPALLLFAGLTLLLQKRIAFGGTLAIIVCAALVGGLAAFTYNERIDQQRRDYRYAYDEALAPDTLLLQVNLETLGTDVTVISAPADAENIRAVFEGSTASTIVQADTPDNVQNGIATLTLRETRSDPFPALDEIGRGTLRVELPQNIALAVSFSGQSGAASFDMDELNLERLNLTLISGDALVTLPAYQPLSQSVQENPGQLRVLDGDLRLVVPTAADGQFVIDQRSNQRPEIDDLVFFLEDAVNRWILQPRNPGFEAPQFTYIVDVPQGRLRVTTAAQP